MPPRDPGVPEISLVLQDLSQFLGTLIPPQMQAVIVVDSPLLRKKAEIFTAIDSYEGIFNFEEPERVTPGKIAETQQSCKELVKNSIEEIEIAENIEGSYSAAYVQKLCASSSRIIKNVLKERISWGRVETSLIYLKYLGDLSKESVLPYLAELDQSRGVEVPALNQYFSILKTDIRDLLESKQEIITPPPTPLQWSGYILSSSLVFCSFCYLTKNAYKAISSGSVEPSYARAMGGSLALVGLGGIAYTIWDGNYKTDKQLFINSEKRLMKGKIHSALEELEKDINEGIHPPSFVFSNVVGLQALHPLEPIAEIL